MFPSSGRLLILGAGESGTGTAVLGRKQGYTVAVSDAGKIADRYKDELLRCGAAIEEGGHAALATEADVVVKSPGIPDSMPVVRNFFEKGIPVISEIEFASRFTDAKMICITGTNGKTTTTLLTHHLLKKAGFHVGLGGNIGRSFARQVAESDFDHYVLELSSFQLDGCFEFKADIAILTNITPDHLDRYDYQLERYIDSKFRILRNQGPGDHFIFCADDPLTTGRMNHTSTSMQLHPFSIRSSDGMCAWLDHDQLTIQTDNQTFAMSIHELALQGKHNIYNSMAAGIAGRILEIRKDVVRESFTDFENIEHRLEFVTAVHGIDFINDSKATNVNST
ncbi:MAG: UDP-N-acetylmuramoyl-L-alanine--D-glutamate ligase, partial [Bacteroidota bacterium]